jgi:hypothetical protein
MNGPTDGIKYVDDSTATESVMVDCSSNLQDLVDYIFGLLQIIWNLMSLNAKKLSSTLVG